MSPAEAAAITEEPDWAQLFKDRGASEMAFENLLLDWRKWHFTPLDDGRKKMAPSVDGVIALAILGIMPPRTLDRPPGLFEDQADDHMWLSVAARAWRIVGIEDCTLFLNSFGEEKQIDLNRANWEKHTEAAVAVLEAITSMGLRGAETENGPTVMPDVEPFPKGAAPTANTAFCHVERPD